MIRNKNAKHVYTSFTNNDYSYNVYSISEWTSTIMEQLCVQWYCFKQVLESTSVLAKRGLLVGLSTKLTI